MAILRALCRCGATFATEKTPNRPEVCAGCGQALDFRDDGHMDAMFGEPRKTEGGRA